MIIIKEIVDCIFDENHMLDWDHPEIVERQTCKANLWKSTTLWIITTAARFYKEMHKVSAIGRICGWIWCCIRKTQWE